MKCWQHCQQLQDGHRWVTCSPLVGDFQVVADVIKTTDVNIIIQQGGQVWLHILAQELETMPAELDMEQLELNL
jgi:hypothetical protein